jgi:hypothetical protein
VTQRQSIRSIEFPAKKINVIETVLIVEERVKMLQNFLRRISSLVCINSLHPSTARIQLALQRFVGVEERLELIAAGEAESEHNYVRILQTFVHSVMQMTVMDKVITGFIDAFVNPNMASDIVKAWTEEEGVAVAEELRGFMDHLQGFLFNCLFHDCLEIVERLNRRTPSGFSKEINALNKINPRNIQLLSASQKIIEQFSDFHKQNVSSHEQSIEAALLAMQKTIVHLSEDESRSIIRTAIRRQVEIAIFVGCSGRLHFVLQKSFAMAEINLWEQVSMLSHESQSFFGIPCHHHSPSEWDSVVSLLKEIRLQTLPIDRCSWLLQVAKEIPRLYQIEHPQFERPLGADDILPIFIFVIVKAQIPCMLALNQELQSLCDPDNKLSETGYYLATLEASLRHLLDADVKHNVGSQSLFPFLKNPVNDGFSDEDSDGIKTRPVSPKVVDMGDEVGEPVLSEAYAADSDSDVIDKTWGN